MGTRKVIYFIKAILIYLAFICLLVGMNFLINISDILNNFNLGGIGGIVFLTLYLFILSVNISFLIRKKTIKDYKLVLLINSIFSILSGIGLRLSDFLVVNNLGLDLSIVYLKADNKSTFFFHYDVFNFVVKFQYAHTGQHVFGGQINLFMWAIGIFLFICYKQIPKWLNNPNPQSV